MLKVLMARITFVGCICGISLAAHAMADAARQVDVPAGGLVPALESLAKQEAVELVYQPEQLRSFHTTGVKGLYAPQEAVRILLKGTPLELRTDPTGAMVIAPLQAGASTRTDSSNDESKEAGKKSSQEFRVAQVDQTASGPQAVSEESKEKRKPPALEEVVVTGTTISGVNPRSSPLSTYGADEIKKSGALTIDQFVAKLPENLNSLSGMAPIGVGVTGLTDRSGAAGVDLRGLGIGSTLVLLDGHRLPLASGGRTPDISLVPLAALQRVDVLTDGASAIYGSDAVAGVVNLVLRRDFDGVETDIGYGGADGEHETRIDQLFGHAWSTGSAMLSYDYLDRTALDASDRSFSAAAAPFSLIPAERRQNVLGSLELGTADTVQASGDFLYSQKDIAAVSLLPLSANVIDQNNNREQQYFADLDLRKMLTPSLNLSGSASYGQLSDGGTASQNRQPTPYFETRDDHFKTLWLEAKLDGSLVKLRGGDLRFAVGGGYSRDTFSTVFINTVGENEHAGLGRSTRFGYAELFIPIVGEAQDVHLMRSLELDIAGRYNDYSDFGSRVSPKVGLLWSPLSGLNLRGTFGESFRAPTLNQMITAGNSYAIFQPAALGLPDIWSTNNSSTMLLVEPGGGNPTLGAESAKSYTFGIDVIPVSIPGLKVRTTYFNIDYQERIAIPDPTGSASLVNPRGYPDLFYVNPSAALIASVIQGGSAFFNTTPVNPYDPNALAQVVNVILDDRYRNLAESKLNGLDLSGEYRWSGQNGHPSWLVGADGSYLFNYFQRITPNSLPNTLVNTLFNPARLKAGAYVGASFGGWNGQITAHYVGGYLTSAQPGATTIGSWTTVDVTSSFTFGRESGSALDGLRAALTIQNLLNRNPPYVPFGAASGTALNSPIGFDPTNANPLGRFIAFDVSKRW